MQKYENLITKHFLKVFGLNGSTSYLLPLFKFNIRVELLLTFSFNFMVVVCLNLVTVKFSFCIFKYLLVQIYLKYSCKIFSSFFIEKKKKLDYIILCTWRWRQTTLKIKKNEYLILIKTNTSLIFLIFNLIYFNN